LAPEILGNLPYWEASDVYSFGIILWEIVARSHPFEEFPFSGWMAVLEDEILRGIRPTIPPDLPSEMESLICSCWKQDPGKRPTFTQIKVTLDKMKHLVQARPPTPLPIPKKEIASPVIKTRDRSRSFSRSLSKSRLFSFGRSEVEEPEERALSSSEESRGSTVPIEIKRRRSSSFNRAHSPSPPSLSPLSNNILVISDALSPRSTSVPWIPSSPAKMRLNLIGTFS
jgi:hypothetical protein